MKKRKTRKRKSSKVCRGRAPLPLRYCLLTALCGTILAAGFFYAARQHFFSMDYSMKNARLRIRVDKLRSKNRRLLLSREIALSPAEIKKAAGKLGLTGMTARNIQLVGRDPERAEAAFKIGRDRQRPEARTAFSRTGPVTASDAAGKRIANRTPGSSGGKSAEVTAGPKKASVKHIVLGSARR